MTRRPQAPGHLDVAARAKWLDLVGQLPDDEPATLDCLAAYCSAWGRMVAAELELAKTGTITKGLSGRKISPHFAVMQAERRAVRQLAAELRLTPRSKRRKRTDETDPILRLIAANK